MSDSVSVSLIEEAYTRVKDVVKKTALERNTSLSDLYQANIFLKREDQQIVRSYKIRGAYNKIASLSKKELKKGVVCASAGNHAQGVALSCRLLKVRGIIYMPKNTPKQKIQRVEALGKEWVTIELIGDTFDEAFDAAKTASETTSNIFVHPFNDPLVIAGQGTVAVEILEQLPTLPDIVVAPIGGGGLISGISTYFHKKSPDTHIVGVQPTGAPSMYQSVVEGKIIRLESIDKFVDGAAVLTPGEHTFNITSVLVDEIKLVPEGRICQEMISLYQTEGIVTEPAGALSLAVLDQMADEIKGKNVVCIVSGGNNDIGRYSEIMERSLIYQGLKHYFIIEFPQRPGALRTYLDEVLIGDIDITLFEYIRKSNREYGPALIGIELPQKESLQPLLDRMTEAGFSFIKVESDSTLFRFLI